MDNLHVAVILRAVDHMTKPIREIRQATTQLGVGFAATTAKLTALSTQAEKLNQFEKIRKQVNSTQMSFGAAQKRVQELGQAMRQTNAPCRVLQQQYQAAQRACSNLNRQLTTQRLALKTSAQALTSAGLSTHHIAKQQQELAHTIDHVNNRLAKQRALLASVSHVAMRFKSIAQTLAEVGKQTNVLATRFAVLGGITLWGLKHQLVDTASQFEKFQTILRTTEGSSAKAKVAMDWVTDFTSKTPYELQQVTDAFVKMRAYGLDPTQGMLRSLGDASAAMGKELNQAVEALADAVVGENERLKEFGISTKTLGNKIQYTYTDKQGKQQHLTANKNDRQAIQKNLMQIFDNKYQGSMDRLSKTWAGMLSNLSDEWVGFKKAIMDAGAFDFLKTKLQDLLDKIAMLKRSGQLDAYAKTLAQQLTTMLKATWAWGKAFVATVSQVSHSIQSMLAPLGGVKTLLLAIAALITQRLLRATLSLAIALTSLGVDGVQACLKLSRGLLGLCSNLQGVSVGIKSTLLSLRTLSLFLLTNPFGLLVTVTAAATYALIHYWQQIRAFIHGMVAGFAQAAPSITRLLKLLFTPLLAVGKLIAWVGHLLHQWLTPVQATTQQLQRAAQAGRAVGEALGKGFLWADRLLSNLMQKWQKMTALFGHKSKLFTQPIPNTIAQIIHHRLQGDAASHTQPASTPIPLTLKPQTTIHQTNHMTINQQPGTSSEELAKKIVQAQMQLQQREQQAKARSLFYDSSGIFA